MAVTNLGTNYAYANSQTIAITSAASVAAGTLVVALVFDGNGVYTGTSVNDSKGNTYVQQTYEAYGSGVNCQLFSSVITTPLTTSDTITYTAAAGFTINGLAIAALSATGYSTLDAATTAGAQNFSGAYSVTGAGSAAVIGELNIACVITNGAPPTPSGSWTAANTFSPPDSLFDWQVN